MSDYYRKYKKYKRKYRLEGGADGSAPGVAEAREAREARLAKAEADLQQALLEEARLAEQLQGFKMESKPYNWKCPHCGGNGQGVDLLADHVKICPTLQKIWAVETTEE